MVEAELAAREELANALAGFVDYGDREFTELTQEIMEDFMAREPSEFVPLAAFHEEWGNTIQDNTYTGIICARGHLKTTFCLSYLLYQMVTQPNFRALYIGATLEQAHNKLEQLEEMCVRSWRLRNQIKETGGLGGGWRKGAKYFNNGSRVHAASVGKALEGPHVHLIILDDVLEEFPRLSDAKVIHYIRRVVMPMRLPDGKVFLIGTQKRVGDATEWVKESKDWATLWHPALKEDGTPRWPEYWSLDRLEREKEVMGSRAFESEYLLNPIDPESAVVPWEVIEPCLDNELSLGMVPEGWSVVMGVDLAVGIDSQHDETSYCVVAWNHDTGDRRIIYSWTGKVMSEGAGWLRAQIDNLIGLAEQYEPVKIMIESNGFQRLVAHAAENLTNLPVSKHTTGSEKHHARIGIPGIAYQLEKQHYQIPWDDAARKGSKIGTQKIVQGLSRLTWGEGGKLEGHTPDAVVALWMCELAVQDYEKKKLSVSNWDWL